MYSGCIQGVFRVYSGCIQGVFRVYSGCIQGVFRVYSGYLRVGIVSVGLCSVGCSQNMFRANEKTHKSIN